MPRPPRSLSTRARILGAILVVASLGLAVVGAVTFLVQYERVLSTVDARLTAQVAALRTVAAGDREVGDTGPAGQVATAVDDLRIKDFSSVADYLRAAVARLVPGSNEASLAVVDGAPRYRPQTLSGFDVSGDRSLIARADSEARHTGTAVLGTAVTGAGVLRYIAVPVTMPDDPARGVYLRAVDLEAELAPVTTAALTYAAAALVVLAAIGAVGWFVAGRLLSPVRRLRDTAEEITLADLGARIPAHGNDDIADLTRTVNSMLERLEGSVDAQRRLLDDVRHELKTPITIVRGHLELMDPSDGEDVAATRALGIQELDRMSRLVADIDLLATVDSGESFVVRPVDVAELTMRAGELVAGIGGHAWSVADVARTHVNAEPDRLLQAWLQLADNAAKYAPPGSPIELGSTRSGDDVLLWVRDHGPGIPVASRRRVFRRFDRAGTRRAVGGSGLGLAIVDAIATSHGGRCDVTETPGGGATVMLRIPLRPSAPVGPPQPAAHDRTPETVR